MGRWVLFHFKDFFKLEKRRRRRNRSKVERKMGRSPCCSKEGLNRGAWTALEDKILTAYIKAHGEGKWRNLPKRAGLKRCGKSCRLRWLNYLRPDIKRGNISRDEEELIIRLHNLLGNRWSLIAGRLPGRTDNEIKNYWNTTLGKKAKTQSSSIASKESPPTSKSRLKKLDVEPPSSLPTKETKTQVIRTKATRCTKVLVPLEAPPTLTTHEIYYDDISTPRDPLELQHHRQQPNSINEHQELDGNGNRIVHPGNEATEGIYGHDTDLLDFGCSGQQFQAAGGSGKYDCHENLCLDPVHSLPFEEPSVFKDWLTNACLEDNPTMDLDSLAFFLESAEEWP